MRSLVRAANAVAIFAAVATSASAQTVNIIGSGAGNSPLVASLFSSSTITVTAAGRSAFGNSAVDAGCPDVYNWGAGYGDLPSAVFACTVGELHFQAVAPGTILSLTNLQLAAFGAPSPYTLAFYGTGYSFLGSFSGTQSGTGHLDFATLINSTDDLYVQWDAASSLAGPLTGPSWDVGLDNVTVHATATPEPASLALLATGMIGLGGAARLRRRKNLAA